MELNILRLTHACSSLIGVLFLSYIWYCYYYRQHNRQSIASMDLALPFLALAYFVWSILKFYEYAHCAEECTGSDAKIIRALSCVNNALFLSSFSYFKHGFQIISKLKHRNRWMLIVWTISIPICIYCLFATPGTSGNPGSVEVIDLLFSSCTLLFMGLLLALAFHNRELSGLAVLALLVVVLEVLAQISSTLGVFNTASEAHKTWEYVIYLVAHSLLLANFIALAFTWIIEDEGVLNKFDLHTKSQLILVEGLQENLSAFWDIQYRLISEHADLDSVARNLDRYFQEAGQDDKRSEVMQHLFSLSNAQKSWNMGHISSKEFTKIRMKVSDCLLQLIKEARNQTNP